MKRNLARNGRFRGVFAAVCCAGWLVAAAPGVFAGISPENVIVVVNAQSPTSRTIANHYIQLRKIPVCNVILLDQIPTDLQIDLPTFKTKILKPVLKQINARGLAKQARVVAYSADFPTAIDIAPHTKLLTDAATRKHQKPVASINGLTFFYRFVLADDPRYLSFAANPYARGLFERHFVNPFAGGTAKRFDQALALLSKIEQLSEIDQVSEPAAVTQISQENQKKASQAAHTFQQLFEQFPTLPTLAIHAAEAHMAAGDQDSAVEMLKSAIAAGWWSGQYLKQHQTLAPLLSRDDFQRQLDALDDAPISFQEPVGFTGDCEWTASGHSIPAGMGGSPHLLSCSLAIVHPRGSTAQQAIDVLKRAATADQSFPQAGFRFSLTKNVRTETRFPQVGSALEWLKHRGRVAELFHSPLPSGEVDCAGLMLGAASIDLSDRKWRLVPGAIAENLTSYGGKFDTAAQSKLTDLLHAGAAISSGTVAEPFALQYKFPLPIMYGYYADGVSAIEAFYLSVSSPYQLLIVGDPICQPFAKRPAGKVSIRSDRTSGKVIRIIQSEMKTDLAVTRPETIELFVNGKLFQQAPAGGRVEIDLPEDSTGAIEIRVVVVGHDMTEPRAWYRNTLMFDGPYATPVASVIDHHESNSRLTVSLSCELAKSIQLFHLGEVVAEVDGPKGSVVIDTAPLGRGPLQLEPVARFEDSIVAGKPIVHVATRHERVPTQHGRARP